MRWVGLLLVVTGCTGATFSSENPFAVDSGPEDAGGVMEAAVDAAPVVEAAADAGTLDGGNDTADPPDVGADVVDPPDVGMTPEAAVLDAPEEPPPTTQPCDRNNPAWRQHDDGWGEMFWDCEVGITRGLALDACSAHFAKGCTDGITCNLPPRIPDDSEFVCGSALDDAGGTAICWGYSGPEGVSGTSGMAYRYDGTLSFLCPHEVLGMLGAVNYYQ